MADHRGSTGRQRRRIRGINTRRRDRVVGVGTALGTFLVFGMTPLATVPAAHADDFGLGDLIGDLLGGIGAAGTGVSDAAVRAALESSGHAVDHALAAVDTVNPLAELSSAPTPEALSAGAETPFQQLYEPIYAAIEDWINSTGSTPFLDGLNQFSEAVGLGPMIADGADGTAQHVDGFDGGWLFGDGGDGWDSTEAGVAGGAGGDANWLGNGGDGGDGGAGAAGGDGGDGGWLFGDGGDGGAAGDGDTPSGLPALGGAGGNGGWFGSHGAVGDYGTLPSGPPTDDAGLGTTGTWFTDSVGRVVILHGLNQVYKVPPYEPSAGGFGQDDAQFLEDNGFNAVRLGVIWAGVEPQPGEFNEAYLESIEKTVNILGEHGIHVILDMHQDAYSTAFGGEGAPDWAVQTGDLYNNPELPFPLNVFFNPAGNHAWDAFWANADSPDHVGLENHYARMWEYVADHFSDNPNVAGYEIMNEPTAGSSSPLCLFGCPGFYAGDLSPFYDQATTAIRAVDPTTPVLIEPEVISGEAGMINLGAVDDPHTVLSFHDYLGPLAELTINSADAYATAHDIPALLTEFGATGNNTEIADTTLPTDQNLIGWTEWEYTDLHDITTTGGGEGWLVQDPGQPLTGDNVDFDKLATLAEPYPQVIAGTPLSWSFDDGDGIFQFSYSTEKVDGTGDFAVGSTTTISVPAVEYPNGYQVTVTGGHVVSDANAPELVIASDGSTTTINVTVSSAAAAG